MMDNGSRRISRRDASRASVESLERRTLLNAPPGPTATDLSVSLNPAATTPYTLTLVAQVTGASSGVVNFSFDIENSGPYLLGTAPVDPTGKAVFQLSESNSVFVNQYRQPLGPEFSAYFTGSADSSPSWSNVATYTRFASQFSGLTSVSVTQGTTSANLSGAIAAGIAVPAGDSIDIYINGVGTFTTKVQANGSFSASINTAEVPVGSYSIEYYFAGYGNGGDVNFSTAEDSTTVLNVTAATATASDLSGHFAAQPPTTIGAGQSVTVAFALTNALDAATANGTYTISFELESGSPALGNGDTIINGLFNSVDLAAGQTSAGVATTISIPSTTSPGIYYLAAVIDDSGGGIVDTDSQDKAFFSGEIQVDPAPTFTWSMPARYGPTAPDGIDSKGIIMLRNSYDYVNPKGYTLNLSAPSIPGVPTDATYTWTVQAATGGISAPKYGQTTSFYNLALNSTTNSATYSVALKVTDSDGYADTIMQSVTMRDILIVQIGDSYGSGEGNPDRSISSTGGIMWADGGTAAMTMENLQAHRSSSAASSQAALKLEASDPLHHFSVTYVNLAESGATTADLFVGKAGIVDSSYHFQKGQIPELEAIVGHRYIDDLDISVGGNDIGFTEILSKLMYYPDYSAIGSGFNSLLTVLRKEYLLLGQELKQNFSIGKTLITAYPDMTQTSPGVYNTFENDIINPLVGISSKAAQFFSGQLLKSLNSAIAGAAVSNGWIDVNGFLSDFLWHGYASSSPWFQTETSAAKAEGASVLYFDVQPFPSSWGKTKVSAGAFHPNEPGLADIASYLLILDKN